MTLDDPKLKAKDRKAIREALITVQRDNADGLLVAEEVVEAAKDEDSPLHECFTWDDTEAAKQYRLVQARRLISCDVIWPDGDKEKPAPRWVSLTDDRKRPGGGYRETKQVIDSKELLEQLEATAKRDRDGVLKRYEMLKSFCAKVRRAAGIQGNARRGVRS